MLSMPGYPVPPAWTLKKIALESGFDERACNRTTRARGLWQCMPLEVHRYPVGVALPKPPAGHFLRANDDGTTSLMREYPCPPPHLQLREAFAFWLKSRGTGFRSAEALYCANLAPARLKGPYDDDTIVYSTNPDDEPLNRKSIQYSKTYWPAAYRDNAAAFGLNPKDPRGRIRMRDLAVGLDAAVKRHQDRYDAELTAAMVANVRGPVPPDDAA